MKVSHTVLMGANLSSATLSSRVSESSNLKHLMRKTNLALLMALLYRGQPSKGFHIVRVETWLSLFKPDITKTPIRAFSSKILVSPVVALSFLYPLLSTSIFLFVYITISAYTSFGRNMSKNSMAHVFRFACWVNDPGGTTCGEEILGKRGLGSLCQILPSLVL